MKQKLLLIFALSFFNFSHAQFDVVQPGPLTICSNNDFGVFNLTSQTPVILGPLSPADYTVTYHTSSAAANGDNNAIPNPASYINTANPQPIWARVEQDSNPANYEIAEFHLVVNLTPLIYDQSVTVCDFDDNPADGVTTFNLNGIREQLWSSSGTNPSEVELNFYLSEGDAMNEINPLPILFTSMNPNQVIYVNASYNDNGCSSISTVALIAENCTGTCLTPLNLSVNGIEGDSATFFWTPAGSETQWEVLVLYAGGPFPLPTMDGVIVNGNPVTFSNFECPEAYDVYIRAVCESSNSDWSQPITFEIADCEGSGNPGEPQNLTACAENGTACFDLTENDQNVLGDLDPSQYTITYHTSAANAEAGTAAIVNPTEYCTTVAMGADEIFIRLENTLTGEYEVFWFTVTAQEIVISTMQLQPMFACDEDQNGTIWFDLTDVQTQLNTSNPLSYYTDLAHALDENDPIAEPGEFHVQQGTSVIVYIRESVEGSCDIIYMLQLNALINCNTSNVCAGANSLCNALGVPFPNTTGVESAESGNDYGCLFETPNPTWFYLPVSGAGTINLMIEQSTTIGIEQADLDIDFIAYGPFTSATAPCNGLLTENNIVSCSFSGSLVEYPVLPNAQPGEYYLIMASNYTDEPGYIRISELGSSQGEINCTGLRLNAFIDSNTNGVQDSGEANFNLGEFHYEVNNNSVGHNITSPSGIHRIYDMNPANTYDLSYTINPDYSAYYGITTASYSGSSVVAGAGLQNYDFPITVTQSYNDVSVTIVPNDAPRPGFTYTNTVIYTNHGNQTVASGTVIFHKDPIVSFISISEASAVTTTNGFTFNYVNLAPFESREIIVDMQVPTIPTVNLGDLITNDAEILPFAGDITPDNNGFVLTQEVIGSYDPNDKMESRGSEILFSSFTSDDYLYYTIRFENTGTASAININVNDVLDPQLDAGSVRMVSASHDYVLDRVDNVLNWKFENILLPPVVEGSDDGHGYITFKVKPLPGFEIGDIIPNTAYIYFDFNPAIITNTFTSEFVSALAVNEISASDFAVFPNPADAVLNISMRNGGLLSGVTIFDISGKKILEKSIGGFGSDTLDVSAIAAGVYFIEVTTMAKDRIVKKIVIN